MGVVVQDVMALRRYPSQNIEQAGVKLIIHPNGITVVLSYIYFTRLILSYNFQFYLRVYRKSRRLKILRYFITAPEMLSQNACSFRSPSSSDRSLYVCTVTPSILLWEKSRTLLACLPLPPYAPMCFSSLGCPF
jgi:hypothetical protein